MNLSDVTLLLTRPRADAERFLSEVTQHLAAPSAVVFSPLLSISYIGTLPQITADTSLVFTSHNGVAAYVQAGGKPGLEAFVVGQRTAEAAQKIGLKPQVIGPSATEMAAHLVAHPPSAPVLHISGRHHRGNLAQRLSEAGVQAQRIVLYDQIAQPLTKEAQKELSKERPVVAPIFSPRTAELLRASLPDETENLHVVALSPAVADMWKGPAQISKKPTSNAMIAAIAALLEALGANR